MRGGHAPASLGSLAATGDAARRREAAREGVLEVVISRILQGGVLVSAAIIVLGVVMWAVRGDAGYPPSGYPSSPAAVLAGALEARPAAVIQVGLLVLLLTPVVRVAASVAVFAVQRDRVFTLMTLVVLALLMLGLLAGGVGG